MLTRVRVLCSLQEFAAVLKPGKEFVFWNFSSFVLKFMCFLNRVFDEMVELKSVVRYDMIDFIDSASEKFAGFVQDTNFFLSFYGDYHER